MRTYHEQNLMVTIKDKKTLQKNFEFKFLKICQKIIKFLKS